MESRQGRRSGGLSWREMAKQRCQEWERRAFPRAMEGPLRRGISLSQGIAVLGVGVLCRVGVGEWRGG